MATFCYVLNSNAIKIINFHVNTQQNLVPFHSSNESGHLNICKDLGFQAILRQLLSLFGFQAEICSVFSEVSLLIFSGDISL